MVLSTSLFTYNPDRRTFTAEASSLDLPFGRAPTRFHLVSHVTGQRRLFTHTATDDTGDGDVTGHWYACGDLKVLIVNG